MMSRDIRSYFTPKTHAKDDDSDVIPESPQMQIKNKGKKSRRKRALSDDSDESSPKKKVQKKIPEPEVGKKGQKSKNSTILKEVKSVELFGSGSIKRTEPMLKKTKVTETGIHSDNEFELSLLDLDEMVELESAKTTKESTNEGKNKTIELLENKKNNSLTKTNSRGKKDDHKKSENEIPKQKSKELKQKTVENCSNDDNDKINHINTQMPTDFSEFIESTERKKDDTPRSKKRKLDKSLNESVLTDEEKHERRIMSAALYKSYLNRSGPKNLGSKQMPKGTSNCLKDCAFVLTGVLDSFEKDDIAKAIADFGGSVKQGVTKKVTHVLAGEDPGPAKMAKAQELGIKIINEDEFLQMITDLSDSKKQKDKAHVDSKSTKKRPKKDKSKSPVDKKYKEVKTENVTRVNNKSKSEIKIEYGNQSKELMNIQKSKSEGMAAGKTEMGEDLQAKEDKSQITTTSGGVYDSCLGVFKSDGQTTDTLLWVDKYKPTSLKQIIGQHGPASNVKKLSDWLTKWYANRKAKLPKPNPWAKNDDGGYYKAALLSGPPGVGKTTTVSLVCKELGFDMVEFNASDTRNKTLIKEQIGELLTTTSLSAYARGETGKQAVTKKHVLVMDEVDGMAGNEDRGGLQELISLIKLTSIPIICICNDRNSQKMRSLVNYCYDLRFKRPTVEQIKSAMMSICFKEKIKIPPDVLSQLIIAAGQDVRQTLHLISIWAAEPKLADPESLRKDAKNIKKDIKLGPWDAVRKVFTASEHTNMSMNDKSDLFFYDYSLSPLFVQENYLQVVPHCPKNKVLEKISIAADSISLGDLVESRIRGSQAWNLLPIQAMYSSVLPGNAMAGHMTGQIQFPGWLGKNSRANKMQRLGQEIHAHTRLSTSGSKSSIFLDYCTHLRDAVVNPMLNDRADGIAQSLEVLESYHLLREDLDSLIELSLWPGQRNPMILVDSKVKAAMTRAYNKRASALPYAPGDVRRARAHARDGDAIEDEGEASEPQEDSDPENDALIKKKKLNEDKPALKKEKPSTSKEKKRKK